MTNSAMLEDCIKKSGLKKSHIAQSMGLSRTSFSNKLNNRCDFWASEITQLCDILKIKDVRVRDSIFFAK